MRFAINIPNFGDYADPRLVADLAREAEAAGWDGLFTWDHINTAWEPGPPLADPWILLAAAALATERIRIGPMVTPVARRRPWKLARETVTLDRLSRGRLILGVGLGFPPEHEFAALGEDAGERVRAELLDEGLDVLTGLWSGEPFSHQGKHYQLREAQFLPTPVQRPRIPIWVAGMWPNRRPFRRAARWDGVAPMHATDYFLGPGQLGEAVAYVRSHRPTGMPFDVIVGAPLPGDPATASDLLRAYRSAGATWFQVGAPSLAVLRREIRSGPPSI